MAEALASAIGRATQFLKHASYRSVGNSEEKILATLRLYLEITQASLASEVGLSVRGVEGNLALCPINPAYEPIMLPADFGADDYRVVGTLRKTL